MPRVDHQSEEQARSKSGVQVQRLQKKIEEGEKRLAELRDASKEQLDGVREKVRSFLS
jgi:hypothetical protein